MRKKALPEQQSRPYVRLPDFNTNLGGVIAVRESEGGPGMHLYLDVEEGNPDGSVPVLPLGRATVRLSAGEATHLIGMLQHVIANHYKQPRRQPTVGERFRALIQRHRRRKTIGG